jgi:hypothetical protein
MNITSRDRHDWLEKATLVLRHLFDTKGYTVPEKVRVAWGWPSNRKGGRIGECWYPAASADGHAEIFLSPEIGIPARASEARKLSATITILATLAHELVHATQGPKASHGPLFKRCAVAIGLTGKMTATVAGPDFKEWATQMIEEELGPFPAGGLTPGSGSAERKKQSTRLLKVFCPECGYTARVTNKWICDAGTPLCPSNGDPMEVAA